MANSRVVVDTDIIIDYLRRRERTLEYAIAQFECALTAISWYELKAIPAHSTRQMQLIARLADVMEVLPFDQEAADHSAAIWRELGRQGMSIGLPDTLIAGICRAQGAPLITRNLDHFQRVKDLVVITPEMLLT